MQNQPMMGVNHVLFGNDLEQFFLNCQHGFATGQTRAIRHSVYMRVDCHGRMTESGIEYNIGGFSPDTRQCFQRFARVRHLASVFFNQLLTGCDHVFGFAVE